MSGDVKRCGGCREVLPVAEFNRCSGKRDGLQAYCRRCQAAHNAARRTGGRA